MSEAELGCVALPCTFKGCKFKARCATSKDFSAPEARVVCRRVLREHWALYHSTEQDKRLMMEKLALKKV